MPRKRERPRIGITMGDPAGIGPEIIVKAVTQETICRQAIPLVIGDGATLDRAKGYVGMKVPIRRIESPRGAIGRPGAVGP